MTVSRYWPRAIIHVDMNAFFASVESRDFPELRGKPIGVTNGEAGTTLITCSYEARARGVKTGMRIYDARKLCPGLIQRPARPKAYAEVSTRIMRALAQLSPDIEVFSVDEAFIDVTHCQRLHGSPERMGRMARELVHAASGGLPCSIGIAGSKSTAKIASEFRKPDGFTVVPPAEARRWLQEVPMQKLCGLGPASAEFLSRYGARTCGDVAALPLSILERRFGVTGKYLWFACQGEDTEPVRRDVAAPKSVGHGKVLPPRTTRRQVVETYLRHMCEKVAARLRRYGLQTGRLYVGLRCPELGDSIGATYALSPGAPDGRQFFDHARRFLKAHWRGEAVTHVQITATDLKNAGAQLDLFAPTDARNLRRFGAVDSINLKYGEFTVTPATLLARSTMPNVIAPAWRPDGLRQHIPD
ncbi:MAG: DNA polymerase IV [Pseudomonadota bacterium]